MTPRIRCRRFCLLGLVLLGASFAHSTAAAEKPPYRTLEVRPCGQPQPTQATPYAYGWFGVSARSHAQRHFGYYRTYTEWSWR